ncbi:MAG TPA: S1C family serine protease, partial [Casimicrobiaceae bacterium]
MDAPNSSPRSAFLRIASIAVLASALAVMLPSVAWTAPAQSTPPAKQPSRKAADGSIDSEKLFGAIVKVTAVAIADARSAATLGHERQGSGVVIGDNGLVLTIGYLIVEADDVKITDARGRTFPATIVGYDHASGLGLVRSVVPLNVAPVLLGDSSKIAERDPVLIA